MRFVAMTAAACSLFACAAFAQETPGGAGIARGGGGKQHRCRARHHRLQHRARQFTISKSRGYTRVRKLAKDENGLWQGTAFKGGSLGALQHREDGQSELGEAVTSPDARTPALSLASRAAIAPKSA